MSKDKNKITVLLADDHALLRAGFASTLRDEGIEVIAESDNADDACIKYRECHPDVAVLDILFQDKKTGLDAIKIILQDDPNARIVILTQHDQDNLIKEGYRSGAMSYIGKNMDTDYLLTAIRKATQGERYFVPSIAERLALLSMTDEQNPIKTLTPREYEVFTRMAEGKTGAEIAEELDISLRTAAGISHTVKNKLGVSRQADITKLAFKYNVIAT